MQRTQHHITSFWAGLKNKGHSHWVNGNDTTNNCTVRGEFAYQIHLIVEFAVSAHCCPTMQSTLWRGNNQRSHSQLQTIRKSNVIKLQFDCNLSASYYMHSCASKHHSYFQTMLQLLFDMSSLMFFFEWHKEGSIIAHRHYTCIYDSVICLAYILDHFLLSFLSQKRRLTHLSSVWNVQCTNCG